jgi:hypothetical protein
LAGNEALKTHFFVLFGFIYFVTSSLPSVSTLREEKIPCAVEKNFGSDDSTVQCKYLSSLFELDQNGFRRALQLCLVDVIRRLKILLYITIITLSLLLWTNDKSLYREISKT